MNGKDDERSKTTTKPWSWCGWGYEAQASTVDAVERQGLAVPCPDCGRQVIRAEERFTSKIANLVVRIEDGFVERWRGHCPCGAELHIVCDYDLPSDAWFEREASKVRDMPGEREAGGHEMKSKSRNEDLI